MASGPGRAHAAAAVAEAEPGSYWLDDRALPAPAESLRGPTTTELAVVGGGLSGWWAALLAKERDPSRDVVVLEAHSAAWAASGRNGGFCSASLTHGRANGERHFPAEVDRLDQLGRDNLAQVEGSLERYRIDCDWERTGELDVAVQPWQVESLHEGYRPEEPGMEWMGRDAVQAEVHSPTYLAGLWDKDGCALVNPARLVWGLRRACLELGVRAYDGTEVLALEAGPGASVTLRAAKGSVRAQHVVLGTNAFRPLLWRLRPYIVPVYDYVLMTEPLSPAQQQSLGWARRQGIGDAGNQFHYYRQSADGRVLWGGYDAVYYPGKRVRPDYDQRPATFVALAAQFFETFPQLEDVRFTHRWGGAIDTCSRFCACFGTAFSGRVAYAVGYTGLGVGATRFGAEVMLDLLAGSPTERTGLAMVRSKPIPFPPEPLATAAIQATRWSLAQADRNQGRRNLWLRALDAIGAGFDS